MVRTARSSVVRLALVGVVAIGAAARPAAAGGAPKVGPENASRLASHAVLPGHTMAVFGLASSPDGSLLASAGIDKSVRLWDPRAGKEVAKLGQHAAQAVVVAFRPDGSVLVSGGYDWAVRSWDVKARKEIDRPQGDPKKDAKSDPRGFPIAPMMANAYNALRPDASMLAYVGDFASDVHVWDVAARKGKDVAPRGEPDPMHKTFRNVAWSGDGKWLAAQLQTGDDAAVVEMWDVAAEKWAATLKAPDKALVAGQGLAVNSDGSRVASVDVHSSTIHVWDGKTGALVGSLKGHAYDAQSEQLMIPSLAFSPDDRLLASGCYDKTIRVWDVAGAKQLASLASKKYGTGAVVWAADGTWLAAADTDGTIEVFTVPE